MIQDKVDRDYLNVHHVLKILRVFLQVETCRPSLKQMRKAVTFDLICHKQTAMLFCKPSSIQQNILDYKRQAFYRKSPESMFAVSLLLMNGT